MLLLVFVQLIVLFCISKCSSKSSGLPTCPTWTYPSPPHNECVCGNSLAGVIICNSEPLTTNLNVKYFCIFFSEELQTTLIGTCPYGIGGILPKNVSQIKDDTSLCFDLHRKGQLCGECEDNYTLPAYSYYLGCVKCDSYKG